MSKYVRFGLIAVGMVLVFTTFSVPQTHAQVLAQILKRMDDHNKALSSIRADVTMVKTNSQLGPSATDTMVGSTSYLPKTNKHAMTVRIDWTKPVQEQIWVSGDNYELYRPRLNQVIVGKTNSAKNNAAVGGALSFISMSREQLKANFTIVYLGEDQISGGTKTWHLELTPKAATSYKTAEMWVDGDGMPRQVKINEQNKDTTTVLLSNIKKNESMKVETFKPTYPTSVKKIKS